MARFVLLYHDCPPDYVRPSHWDLMLEVGDILRTWALVTLPQSWETWRTRTAERFPDCRPVAEEELVSAEALGDHRRDYLEFEGDVSGGRGHVVRVARGEYEVEDDSPALWLVSLRENGVTRQIQLNCKL